MYNEHLFACMEHGNMGTWDLTRPLGNTTWESKPLVRRMPGAERFVLWVDPPFTLNFPVSAAPPPGAGHHSWTTRTALPSYTRTVLVAVLVQYQVHRTALPVLRVLESTST